VPPSIEKIRLRAQHILAESVLPFELPYHTTKLNGKILGFIAFAGAPSEDLLSV
jgi:hypothetical protein